MLKEEEFHPLTIFKIMLQRFNEVERINFDVNENVQHLDALSPIHRYQTTVTIVHHEIATLSNRKKHKAL
jgi:hypothetical protein